MFPGDGGEPDLSGKPEKLPGMKSFHGEKVGTNNARKSILASKGVGGDIHIRKSRGGGRKSLDIGITQWEGEEKERITSLKIANRWVDIKKREGRHKRG